MTPSEFSFTQPMCRPCFDDFVSYTVEPVALLEPELEYCCQCGESTWSGIYTRIDPADVAFPTRRKS